MKTPDPIVTTEQLAAFAAAFISAVVVLFKLDLSDAQQGAMVTIITSVWTAFTLYHAARVRGSRAINAQGVEDVKTRTA